MPSKSVVVYVDVDDTLVRWAGSKRLPVGDVARRIRNWAADGAVLYCWSRGGADYARRIAEDLGLAGVFVAFLPKPQILLDDEPISRWKDLREIHPLNCPDRLIDTVDEAPPPQ